MDSALLVFSFSAGILAFFSPCSFPLLPAYISYFFSEFRELDDSKENSAKAIKWGLGFGFSASLGFITIFILIGIISSSIGSVMNEYFPYLAIFMGIVIIILGIIMLLEIPLSLKLPIKFNFKKTGYSGFFLFGIAYALVSLSCVFPIFLMVVLTTFTTQGFLSGILIFILYGLGMSLFMMIITTIVISSRHQLAKRFDMILPYVNRIGGFIMVFAGIWLIYNELLLL